MDMEAQEEQRIIEKNKIRYRRIFFALRERNISTRKNIKARIASKRKINKNQRR
jgi:hypothetical protein